MRSSFDETFSDHKMVVGNNFLQRWINQLGEMGFHPIGVKVEKLPLWGGTYREVALISQEAETFASIVLHPNGHPSSFYYYTPLQNGGMVFTRNHPSGLETESDKLSIKNIPSTDFRKLLDSHLLRLAEFKGRGLNPQTGSGQLTRMDATGGFYESEYRRRSARYILSTGTPNFLFLILVLVGAAIWFALHLR
jgi:hypothetical protein